MISYLVGKIKNLNEKSLTLLTNSGVGYKVFTPLNTLLSLKIGQDLELLISTIVKDDAIDLYGFINQDELSIFEKLITVSGVGPRSALAMLSISTVSDIATAVETHDLALLTRTPGIGKKTCEKIIIELKGKLILFLNTEQSSTNTEENDARLALVSLGYNERDINQAINNLKNQLSDFTKLRTNEIIKRALNELR